MRISDWSSDVCSSDLTVDVWAEFPDGTWHLASADSEISDGVLTLTFAPELRVQAVDLSAGSDRPFQVRLPQHSDADFKLNLKVTAQRSEEHPTELQSLMRNSYAVFCLKKTST